MKEKSQDSCRKTQENGKDGQMMDTRNLNLEDPYKWRYAIIKQDTVNYYGEPAKIICCVLIIRGRSIPMATYCYPAFEDGEEHIKRWVKKWESILSKIAAAPALIEALSEAVEKYGKPGGPWNVPGEPGSWIAKAKEALRIARGEE